MRRKTIIILITSFLLFAIDRISKYLTLNKLQSDGVYLFKKIVYIKLEKNTGIAFSIALPKIFIITLSVLIIFLLFYFLIKYYKEKNTVPFLLTTLIVVGAISNLLDRLFYSYVIDFINISIFPTFNFSDVYIFVAVLIFIFLEYRHKKTPPDDSKGVS